jgi:hypothetical protein
LHKVLGDLEELAHLFYLLWGIMLAKTESDVPYLITVKA